ncbi:MAG: gliding motility-associated C-terminal domain-containing protein [Bacteroidota bacterium]
MRTKNKIHVLLICFSTFLSCQNDDNNSGQLICCSNRIDNNINKLSDFEEFESLDDIQVFNWFTPNGDGLNDVFFIQNIQQYENHSVEIFRLNGELIFESKDYGSGNLTTYFTGEGLSQGSYEYRVIIENENIFLEQGFLCLITKIQSNFSFEPFCHSQRIPDPLLTYN